MSKKIYLVGMDGKPSATHIFETLKKQHGEENVIVLTEEEFRKMKQSGEITSDELINPPIDTTPFRIENIPMKSYEPFVDSPKEKRSWDKNNRKK